MPLIGRTEEMKVLMAALESAIQGYGAVLLIEGEGGSGKTPSWRELMSSSKSAGFFKLISKAQQTQTTPLGVLREAVDEVIVRAEKSSPDECTRILRAIQNAAGESGGIVRRLSPGLQALLADVPDVPPLGMGALSKRDFIRPSPNFSRHSHNLLVPRFFKWMTYSGLMTEPSRSSAGLPER